MRQSSGRNRNKNGSRLKLPPGVSLYGSNYVLRRQIEGKRQRINLCSSDSSLVSVIAAYDRATVKTLTVTQIFDQWLSSDRIKALKAPTQRDYTKCANRICLVYGASRLETITTKSFRQYMDIKGEQSKRWANYDRTVFVQCFKWAKQYYDVDYRDIEDVLPYKLTPRKRYVTDAEYIELFNEASTSLKSVMEIAYLCAARLGDVIKIRMDDVNQQGIFIAQGKTGKAQIKEWTPRLKVVTQHCINHPKRTKLSTHLILADRGEPYSISGFESVFQRARMRIGIYGTSRNFTLHDLKKKAISDFEGDKKLFSGHKTDAMVEMYNITADVTPTLVTKLIDWNNT